MFKRTSLFTVLFLVLVTTANAVPIHVDAKIKKYTSEAGVSGVLNITGSFALNNLISFWSEEFKRIYPDAIIQLGGGGSKTAPPALIADTSQVGAMSREMDSSEIEQFINKFGYKPTKIVVALDSLAIYVNRNNPIRSLSLDEVDAIFSKTYLRGLQEITTWGQLGLSGKLEAMPINIYGHYSASGTYGYFKEYVLNNGDYKNTVNALAGSASVVEAVANDISAIGYSGIGYATSGVRAVPLSDKKGGPVTKANYQNVLMGKYPLSRMLYIYVNKKPGEPLPKVVLEFIRFVLSKEGQKIVIRSGFDPLTARLVQKQLNLLK